MFRPMRLDPDIDTVEARIVRRRHELTRVTQASGQRAMKTLASPGFLIGAAVVGFLVAGGFASRKKEAEGRMGRRRNDPAARSAAKTGIAGLLGTGAMWAVRAKFGSPVGLAQYIASMVRRRQATSARHSFR
jgi:hypothetical protein